MTTLIAAAEETRTRGERENDFNFYPVLSRALSFSMFCITSGCVRENRSWSKSYVDLQ